MAGQFFSENLPTCKSGETHSQNVITDADGAEKWYEHPSKPGVPTPGLCTGCYAAMRKVGRVAKVRNAAILAVLSASVAPFKSSKTAAKKAERARKAQAKVAIAA